MAKLYACIISSDARRNSLVAVAQMFAHAIERIDDGVLFDVSGLERLMGKPDRVAQKILGQMQKQRVAGSVAVAETVDTAMLLARCTSPRVSKGDGDTLSVSPLLTRGLVQPDMFKQLPLTDLKIERDTLNVFSELGLRSVNDLLAVPNDELVSRYGREFRDVIDVLEQRGRSFVTPNVKENRAAWSYELDNPVEDFERLIFLLNHGLERLFGEVKYCGFSTEHLDIKFKLCRSPHGVRASTETKSYEIKTSFPTLDRAFWLKFINLRGSLDPPEASIISVDVIAHFARPRPAQRGLYAVARPEPESLLLTVNKLKKLVGEENVGVPTLLNQRLAEAFVLDADSIPNVITGSSNERDLSSAKSVVAFTYFRPPLAAEVLVRDARLVFIRTRRFAGHVTEYSGVWKGNSHWWDRSWKTQEWDIEVENAGVYRLCKAKDEWFLMGEYD